MSTAILDTNVVVRAVISPRGTSFQALRAVLTGRSKPVLSSATLGELERVLSHPEIVASHGWTTDELANLLLLLTDLADFFPGQQPVSATLTRDLTDTKFLSLAAESCATYLVTNDRRHLLRLGHYGATRIVTPAAFLRELP